MADVLLVKREETQGIPPDACARVSLFSDLADACFLRPVADVEPILVVKTGEFTVRGPTKTVLAIKIVRLLKKRGVETTARLVIRHMHDPYISIRFRFDGDGVYEKDLIGEIEKVCDLMNTKSLE